MAKFRVMKEGYTDPESTDIWKFVLHESYPTFKVGSADTANFQMLAGTDNGYHDIVHNLGYFPMFIANITYDGVSYQVPANMYTGIEIQGEFDIAAVVFYAELTDLNTIRVGAYCPADYALNDEDFTVDWIIMLDEF